MTDHPTDRPAPADRDPYAGDPDLARDVRRSHRLIDAYCATVVAGSLYGQVSGAIGWLRLAPAVAILVVGALDLGGIVVFTFYDVRRRLGEAAWLLAALSAAVAFTAGTVNYLVHTGVLRLLFPVLTGLAYVLYVGKTEARRRDRMRANGTGRQIVPTYELVGHWLAHPWLTLRARTLAKHAAERGERLGRYESVEAARAGLERERRNAALTRRLRARLGRNGDLADAVYDADVIAERMRSAADNPAVADALMADLAADAVARPNADRRSAADRKATPTDAEPTGRAVERSPRPAGARSAHHTRPVRKTTVRAVAERSPNWAARENARLLASRYYPTGLPADESIGRVRGVTGWSFERARDAVLAYRQRAHLADDDTDREAV